MAEGFILNLDNTNLQTKAFSQTYVDNQSKTHNAIGSFNYGSMNQNITKVDRSHETSIPGGGSKYSATWWKDYFIGRDEDGGYDLGTNNFAVNNLNPDNKTNDGTNRFINGFLDTELNYWYYTTFSDVLSGLPNYNANLKRYTDLHNFLTKYLEYLLKFTFSGKYNDIETTSYSPNTYDKFLKPFVDVLIGKVVDKFFGPEGWLVSWATSEILDQFLGGVTANQQVVNHRFAWQSESFKTTDMDNIFSEMLGNDDPKAAWPVHSAIKEFLDQNNGQYPSSLTLNNFQFNVHNYSATNSFKNYLAWDPNFYGGWDHVYGPANYHQGGTDTGSTSYNLQNIEPDFTFDIAANRAAPSYVSEKKVLDDPNIACENVPLIIGDTTAQEWNQGLAVNDLKKGWEYLGGLPNDLENDVVFKTSSESRPTNTTDYK